MKSEAKILICYNSPVSIFSIYNGKPADESLDSKDLSEHSFASNMLEIENHLKAFLCIIFMGNNLNSGHSSEDIGRMLLTLENFTVEGEYLDVNKIE